MRSSVEPLEGNKVKVSVEVDEAEFDKAIDAAFRKIARQTRIPGFRPGKAPRRILEARLGPDVAREEAIRDSLPDYYIKALEEQDVDAIAAPEIEITSGQDSLFYIGDSMHHSVISVQKPDWPMAFDADQKVGVASRVALVDQLAKSGERVFAVHFPFPGLGKIQKQGDTNVWVAE